MVRRRKVLYKWRAFGSFNGQNKLQNIHHVIDSVMSQAYIYKIKESKTNLKWQQLR